MSVGDVAGGKHLDGPAMFSSSILRACSMCALRNLFTSPAAISDGRLLSPS